MSRIDTNRVACKHGCLSTCHLCDEEDAKEREFQERLKSLRAWKPAGEPPPPMQGCDFSKLVLVYCPAGKHYDIPHYDLAYYHYNKTNLPLWISDKRQVIWPEHWTDLPVPP